MFVEFDTAECGIDGLVVYICSFSELAINVASIALRYTGVKRLQSGAYVAWTYNRGQWVGKRPNPFRK